MDMPEVWCGTSFYIKVSGGLHDQCPNYNKYYGISSTLTLEARLLTLGGYLDTQTTDIQYFQAAVSESVGLDIKGEGEQGSPSRIFKNEQGESTFHRL